MSRKETIINVSLTIVATIAIFIYPKSLLLSMLLMMVWIVKYNSYIVRFDFDDDDEEVFSKAIFGMCFIIQFINELGWIVLFLELIGKQ